VFDEATFGGRSASAGRSEPLSGRDARAGRIGHEAGAVERVRIEQYDGTLISSALSVADYQVPATTTGATNGEAIAALARVSPAAGR
jgi:hypothetical protein